MKIRKKEIIDKFSIKHADSTNALQHWADAVKEAEWKSHSDIKVDFPSADYIGKGRYVFNIKGNNYRLIVVIVFITGSVIVDFVGTHSEYDKLKL
ncbi:MAG: type II toxin-antitoxin system HigB family toxin [Paludibacter sp.]|jgi:mRNA interferase HigB|nr:type II toxin-antitoxin system HigB family toxin [Paludibacter sp.]